MIISFETRTNAWGKQKMCYYPHIKDEELEVMDMFMA